MNAIWVYISWSADQIDRILEDAKRTDEIENVQRIMQAIDNGNELWKSWALSHDGTVVSMSGTEGCIKIGADHLADLVELRERYSKATKSTVSVGVAPKLSESEIALQRAQSEGGDRIQLFMEEDSRDDEGKLSKADKPALNSPAAGGGMTGPSMAPAAAPAAPVAEGSEHSENEALQNLIDTTPPPPEASGPDMDQLKDFLSSSADAQGQKDTAEADAAQSANDKAEGQKDIKAQILKILKVWKTRGVELEKLSEKDPELYKSMVGMLQTMVAMAKELFGENPAEPEAQEPESGSETVSKSEFQKAFPGDYPPSDRIAIDAMGEAGGMLKQHKGVGNVLKQKAAAAKRQALAGIPDPGNLGTPNGRCKMCGTAYEMGPHDTLCQDCDTNVGPTAAGGAGSKAKQYALNYRIHDVANRNSAERQNNQIPLTDIGGRAYDVNSIDYPELGRAAEYGMTTAEKQSMPVEHGYERPNAYGPTSLAAMRDRARKQGLLGKAALEAGKTGRHNVVLPPGSQKDAAANGSRDSGQIKILDPATGRTKWRSVRAGLVMAPDGTPVSSRNPSGGK